MCRNILMLIAVFGALSPLKAQLSADYTIYYDFTCISDTTEQSFWPPREYMLLGVGHESTFITSGRYYNDSMIMVFRKEYPEPDLMTQKDVEERLDLYMEKRQTKSVGSDHKIFKHFDRGTFRLLLPLSIPTEYMEESMELEWELTVEVDSLMGLACYKAITNYGGRRYFAWFTPKIPVNNGPWTFQGLPGLIVKVTDDQGWYTFTATKIITDKTERYLKPDWINEYSREIDRKTIVDKMTKLKHDPGVPMGIVNFPPERLLARKKAYAKRFDLVLEQY